MMGATIPATTTTRMTRTHLDAWAIVDCPGSTSSDCATNSGVNAKRKPTDAIYGRKILIKEEKGQYLGWCWPRAEDKFNKKGSTQPQRRFYIRVSSVDGLVIMPIDASNDVRVPPLHHTPTHLKLLWMWTKFEETESATIVDRRVTSLIRALTPVLILLWHHHLLQHHHPTHKPRKRRRNIQKVEDRYDPDLGGYYMERRFPKYRSHDWVIKLVFLIHLELSSLL
jgi:hypothetical protein